MASFLQTSEWAAFKAKYGWQIHRAEGIFILSRKILFGRSLWYAPETELTDRDKISRLLTGIQTQAKADNAFAFRLETSVPYSTSLVDVLREHGFKKSFESVQPEWRWVVDIRSVEEQILSSMHQKGRYNIRVAERHGVAAGPSSNLDTFSRLYQETAKRDGFSPRGSEYFQDFLHMVPGATLFIASKNKTPLAAAIVVFYGEVASYLYGASSTQDRQVMAPYLLHWEIIKEAKRRGCLRYDLGEVPPVDQPNHPLKGLGEFKMKFGGETIHLLGSWDKVFRPLWYNVFRVGEKLRRGFRA